MKSTVPIITLAAATATLGSCGRHVYPKKFTSPFVDMAVFGDSFSDVGNIHNVSNGTQPGASSYKGRYSDGKVWEEYLLQFFDLPALTPSTEGGLNYAYGGATVNNSYIGAFSTYLNDNVPSVKDQVTEYIDNQKGSLSSERLHVIYAGYNDIWWYVFRNYTTSDGQDLNFANVYNNIATNIVRQVDALYQKGARQFLIGNVPNMSSWAEASLQPQYVLESYDALVSGLNDALSRLLSDFESSHDTAVIYEQDNFRAFECLDQNQDFYGIANVKNSCDGTCEPIFSYKFWDYYHPTTHAQQIASTFAIQAIYDKEMERKAKGKRYVKTALRKRH